MSTSTAVVSAEELAQRKRLKEQYLKMAKLCSLKSSPDKLDQLKQFAETLREELANQLEENKDRWLSKEMLQNISNEKRKSIEEYQEVIDEMNTFVAENEEADDGEKEENHPAGDND